jgi:hypothetical protein
MRKPTLVSGTSRHPERRAAVERLADQGMDAAATAKELNLKRGQVVYDLRALGRWPRNEVRHEVVLLTLAGRNVAQVMEATGLTDCQVRAVLWEEQHAYRRQHLLPPP